MVVALILENCKEQMKKSLDFFQSQLGKVRTGRASASLVENVMVDAYGSTTPLSQVGGVSAPDARTIVIQPWDATLISEIEKAIRSADLGFNPQNDGKIVRVPVPPLTDERRKEFVKLCKKYCEEAKIAVRNIRRDEMEALKKAEKAKEISEDDLKKGETDVQKLTDDNIKQIDAMLAQKEKELMED